jgi:hypothetical protein
MMEDPLVLLGVALASGSVGHLLIRALDAIRKHLRPKNATTARKPIWWDNRARARALREKYDLGQLVDCPCGCRVRASLEGIIIHLNDGRKWDRDRVANWVDEVYKEQEVR